MTYRQVTSGWAKGPALVLACLLVPMPAVAMPDDSLDEAVRRHGRVRAGWQRLNEARAAAGQSVVALLPALRLGGDVRWATPDDHHGGPAEWMWGPLGDLDLPLPLPWTVSGTLAAASGDIAVATARWAMDVRAVGRDLTQAFLDLGVARVRLAALADAERRAGELSDAVAVLERQGLATTAQHLEVETARDLVRAERLLAEPEVRRQEARVRAFPGIDPRSDLWPGPEWAAELTLPATADVPRVVALAPERLEALARRRRAEAQSEVARSRIWPRPELFARGQAMSYAGQLSSGRWVSGQAPLYALGGRLVWEPREAVQQSLVEQRSQAQLRAAEGDLEAATLQLAADLEARLAEAQALGMAGQRAGEAFAHAEHREHLLRGALGTGLATVRDTVDALAGIRRARQARDEVLVRQLAARLDWWWRVRTLEGLVPAEGNQP
ncbi:MAG: TolC family protein [Candidatus Sericytochromatia bacterium]|nr:TolC family protein [Candidatus Tanganyikabacteria bacterium]